MTNADWLLFTLNTLTLLAVAFAFAATALWWFRSETKEISTRLEELERHVAGAGTADVKTELGEVETRLKQNLGNAQSELDSRIDGVNAALKQEVAGATQDLGSGVANVKTELGNVETRLKQNLGNAQNELDSRIDGVNAALKQEVAGARLNPTARPLPDGTDDEGASDAAGNGSGSEKDPDEQDEDRPTPSKDNKGEEMPTLAPRGVNE